MKKYLLLAGIVVVMGAGCAGASSDTTSNQAAGDTTPVTQPATPPAQTGLQDLPAVDAATAAKVDVTGWSKTTLKAGVTLTVPTKGAYAPTWTSSLLDATDPALKDDGCYVTAATVYKRTDFTGFTDKVCLTTTAYDADSGTRTDYFTFRGGNAKGKVVLFTFTKAYAKGFDQAAYTATLEKVVGQID